ncbi:dTDP-glucose 4,6-dehydratase [Cytobacillus luteolus]|uniref:dTDP-glucose 4,6-dehydratase n=1 Tax=Litchfieldia luteola TaxID=682179 RepID=UPI001AE70229|nr:dTDP-glucose 4,6-dehydratase [Cytobacillus luteolus]MBP1943298.1 dTDP-glucose 4,6-dehydratase [Cytobacillus luteolus]
MNILVTGGAGFIGSNFINYMLKNYTYNIINIDVLTYAADLRNLRKVENASNYRFIKGTICDRTLIEKLFKEFDIDTVINFAAESHVDRSIEYPDIFIETNVVGTQVLLNAAKKHWQVNGKCEYKENVKFIQVSTDEVYGSLGKEDFFTEETNLAPNSPYSASKAAADVLVRAYHNTYGLPMNITRCSNNYGPNQYSEKLIPLMIKSALEEVPLPVYGDGMHIRDWLHVLDHCKAIDIVLHKGKSGQVYNIGGNNEMKNIDVVKLILRYLGKKETLIKFVPDRLGHDRRYAIDHSKITSELGWIPTYSFEEGLKQTVNWYMENLPWLNIDNPLLSH